MKNVRPPDGAPPAALTALTFPAKLLSPQRSQFGLSADTVTDRITQLDAWAQQRGTGFGILFTFELNPSERPTGTSGWEVAATVLGALAHEHERVALERRNGRWGLYFSRSPALIAQDRRVETMPLREAPLEARQRFLVRSEDFVRAYLALCEARLGGMREAIAQADRTLALLDGMRLE